MEFKEVLFAFMLAGLFLFSIISFGMGIGDDNNANQNIRNDPLLNSTYGNLNTQIDNDAENVTQQKEGWETEDKNVVAVLGDLLFGSIRNLGKVFSGTTKAFFNIFKVFGSDTLGIPGIVITLIFSMLGLLMIFLGWRLIKTGT